MYGDAALFGIKFFDIDELITQYKITPSDYNTLYPLFTFDVSKQKEKVKITRALNPVEKTLNVLIENFKKNQRPSIGRD